MRRRFGAELRGWRQRHACCTLRAAIEQSDASAGQDTIEFAIPPLDGSEKTIAPATAALPTVADAAGVVIDGYTQDDAAPNTLAGGNDAVLRVVLAGNVGLPFNADGLRIVGGNSAVRGLVIHSFPDAGIELAGAGNNNLIEGNIIGLNAAGDTDLGNGGSGIFINNPTSNLIGGTTPASRNVISGNGGGGFALFSGSQVIQGNFIGTNKTGTTGLGNTGHGIFIAGGAGNNRIGDAGAAGRNVISANTASGIGTNPGGGGNTIRGNYLGSDVTGTSDLGNGLSGIDFNQATNNTVGGSAAGDGNLISGNTNAISLGGNAGGTVIQGNLIGTQADGVSPLGNSQEGISYLSVVGGTIGGVSAGEANTIAFNGFRGVNVRTSFLGDSMNIDIRANSIHSNGSALLDPAARLGIDLNSDGVTANDADDVDTGSNGFQNFPVLSSAVTSGSSLTIDGSLNAAPSTTFDIDFFSNASCSSAGNGEGEVFLGTDQVTTDAAGDVAFSFTYAVAVAAGRLITATATDPSGNTSEFSECETAVTPPPTPTPSETPTSSETPTLSETPTPTLTATPLCEPTPRSGCRAPGKTLLVLKDNADDLKDKLTWKWLKGAETLFAALGDPTGTTDAALCIYDSSPVLVAAADVPAGSAWTAAGSSGYKYLDPAASADGTRKVTLKSGAAGRAKVLVKGRGSNLPDPVLPLAMPVTVQFVNDAGECWSSTYTSTPIKNEPTLFKVKE